jgi:NADPH-dependent curcumin reductase CurA
MGFAVSQLSKWVSEGSLTPLQTTRAGLEELPQALVDLFQRKNIGSMIVEIPE